MVARPETFIYVLRLSFTFVVSVSVPNIPDFGFGLARGLP